MNCVCLLTVRCPTAADGLGVVSVPVFSILVYICLVLPLCTVGGPPAGDGLGGGTVSVPILFGIHGFKSYISIHGSNNLIMLYSYFMYHMFICL